MTGCGQFPKDPENTLNKVRNNVLRAGITENHPYVIIEGAEPAGTEVELIKGLARKLNARIEWTKGSEETIMTLLKERELDICAGGFNKKSLWKKHVFFVTPHDTLFFTWGVPSGTVPAKLKDKDVYVKRGSVAGAFVSKKNGKPIYKDTLNGKEPVIAAPADELRKLGYKISKETLKKEEISLAVPKGENAFIEKLETYILSYGRKNKR